MFMEFWDVNNTMLDCNQKMLEIFGVSDIKEFTERFYEFSPPYQPCGMSSYEKNIEMTKLAIENGHSRSEWMFILPSGEELPSEATWVHIEHLGKSMIIVYSQDLRPVKAAIKKEQLAEEKSLAKTRFLAHMSHEIRTPMNAVLGIAEIQLQKGNHAPETEEAFLRICSAAKQLLYIINDILDLSRVATGNMEIIPAVYDMASLIVDTVQLNQMYIGDKKIDFILDIDSLLPLCLIGDELRIKQVLNNLLSNAIKYTMQGKVTFSMKTEASHVPGEVILLIRISDTGQGMAKEQLDDLFDEFRRFNLTTNQYIEGSGLGMPITHSLVKLMHGIIEVESELGKGSDFTVRIPQRIHGSGTLGEEAFLRLQKMEISQVLKVNVPKISRYSMPYGRVLVVDDVDINLYVAEGILAPYKIAVETACSGSEAIEKIKSGQVYNIIFMDHMMPGMDGIEAVKIIRNMGYAHPIVALTANAIKGIEKMFLDNGFSGFISKPIDIHKIDDCLRRFIRDRQTPPVN